jgi:hypothetical protein
MKTLASPAASEISSLVAHILKKEEDNAVTVARLVTLPNLRMDSMIVAATPKAAAMFGFIHPDELIGRLVSEIWHPDDALRTRLYSLARGLGEKFAASVPHSYPMRLLKFPRKKPVWVWKEVEQVQIEGTPFWVTRLAKLDQRKTYHMPDLPNIDAVVQEHMQRNFLHPTLPHRSPEELREPLILFYDDNKISAVYRQEERFSLECRKCWHKWMPRKLGRPNYCPNCKSPRWWEPRLRRPKYQD